MVRQMGNYNVLQRTKDGYFDANALLNQWNKESGNTRRRKDEFLNLKTTISFIEALGEELSNGGIPPKAYHEKKGRMTSKGKTKDELWMHPYLFIDFSMYLNPKFKVKVIKFVYDQLIQQRDLAGDNYKALSSSLTKLKGHNFQEVAKAIQWIVYNKVGKEQRQKASQEQLNETNEIQSKLSYAIEMGFITSYPQLLQTMRKMYNEKYRKF